MHSLNTIKSACQAALDTIDTADSWQRSYCALVDPKSVLGLVHRLETLEKMPGPHEMQALGKLIRDLAGYVKMIAGDKPDSVRDDLLLQARQMIGQLEI